MVRLPVALLRLRWRPRRRLQLLPWPQLQASSEPLLVLASPACRRALARLRADEVVAVVVMVPRA